VLGFGCQESESLSSETFYETPSCRNSEKIEHRTSNVQHRTSNIDGAALYRILKQANRRILPRRTSVEGQVRFAQSFIKLTEFIIRYSIFSFSEFLFSIKLDDRG
jgi:hypothetical protein